MHNKALTLNEINKKIDEYESIKILISKSVQEPAENIDSKILKRYIEIQSVTDTAEYLNSNGYRIKIEGRKGERKYISNDIKDIILNAPKDSKLAVIAKALFNYNKGKVSMNQIVNLCKNS